MLFDRVMVKTLHCMTMVIINEFGGGMVSALTTHSLQVALETFWRKCSVARHHYSGQPKGTNPPFTANTTTSANLPFIVCLLIVVILHFLLYNSGSAKCCTRPTVCRQLQLHRQRFHLQMLATLSLPLLIRVLGSSTANRATLMQIKSIEKAKTLP